MSLVLYDLCGRDPELRFSPYCWRAKMALAHKGLAFDAMPKTYADISAVEGGASKTLPVISDGGRVVFDSFEIALYLDHAHRDRPKLFEGESGVAAARFLDSWTIQILNPIIMRMVVKDIHAQLTDADQAYFRQSREARLGRTLESHQTGVEANLEAFGRALEPARRTLQRHPWLSGTTPLFSDYILFGTLMWLRTIAGQLPLAGDDAVLAWFGRCLDLHSGLAARAKTAQARI
jgi:glutathione S-transferase